MKLIPPEDETIEGDARTLRSRDKSCVDIVEDCLARIDEWEARVHAWVRVDGEGALARARELDEELAAGKLRGPLHGIPIGIKDIIDVAGIPTAAGCDLFAQTPAEHDAELVARLRAAGAVILGKTVTTQFACFDPPATRNPWNLDRTPGGSSSGSAAAVATGMCLGAVGSQTGGSITRPASFCGVAGCKPTFGRVSVDGVLPVAESLDHPGPIARTVRDLALLLDVMMGLSNDVPNLQIAGVLDQQPSEPPKIGRLGGFFETMAQASALEVLERALQSFSRSGALITPVPLPGSFDDLLRCHRVIMAVELAAYHEQRLTEHPDDYLPGIRALMQEGFSVAAAEYVQCRRHQEQSKREIGSCFASFDVLICPATLGPAPDRSTTGDPAFNAPWSYTGLPTVSLPIGLDADGIPLAIQLVGHAYDETKMFRTAAWCEQVIRSQLL